MRLWSRLRCGGQVPSRPVKPCWLKLNLDHLRPGPPGFGGPPSAEDVQIKAAQRARINDLMRVAVQMEQRGNKNAAIRFASSADALVRSSGVALNPQAESPAQFLARLQGKPQGSPMQPPAAAPGNTFASAGPESAARAPMRPAPSLPGTDTPEKKQAKELLSQARRAFNKGDMATARSMALSARKMTATWDLFEENPDQLLADIERKSNTTTFSADPGPNPFLQETPGKQTPKGNPFATNDKQPKPNPFVETGAARSRSESGHRQSVRGFRANASETGRGPRLPARTKATRPKPRL